MVQVRALAPKGVDLILDCVAGSYAEQNLEVLAPRAAPRPLRPRPHLSRLCVPSIAPSIAPSTHPPRTLHAPSTHPPRTLYAALQSLAVDGRWVLYSLLGGPALPPTLAPTFMSQLLRKRVQLIATTLRTRSTPFKRALVQDFAARALPRLGGDLAIVIDREFDGLEQAQAAHAERRREAS